MSDKDTYPSEVIEIGDKMLNDCLDFGLGFTDSICLSGRFIESEVKRLKHLIEITPTNKQFFALQVQHLEKAQIYLMGKL